MVTGSLEMKICVPEHTVTYVNLAIAWFSLQILHLKAISK